MDNIKGFALIDKYGRYLYMEQVGSNDIDVYSTPIITQAHLFESKSKAEHEARSMVTRNGSWNYMLCCDEPVAIVELTIVTSQEVVQELIG